MAYAAGQHRQGSERADNNRVRKDLYEAQQPQLSRIGILRCRIGHGCRAHAGFVGEDAPGTAGAQAHKGRADDPAGDSSGRKRAGNDGGKGRKNIAAGSAPEPKGTAEYTRLETAGTSRSAAAPMRPDAAKEHCPNCRGHQKTNCQISEKAFFSAKSGKDPIYAGDNGIYLRGIAHAKGRNNAEGTVEVGQEMPFSGQSPLNHVHGPANQFSTGQNPVVPGQRHLCKLCSHTHKAAQPHPEYGTGAAQADGTADADDISRPDGSRQSCAEGLEGGNRSGFLFPGRQAAQRSWEKGHLWEP